ncbi:MAG: ribosomal subunit interface protein [Rhodospirillaceae bacterium]|nr:ribosomal subunit interface protein [Rhodospirillaceae bacterium]
MKVTVSGKQVDVGESLRSNVIERITSGASKYFDRAIEGQVVFAREGIGYRVDVTVHAGTGVTVQSHATNDDMHAAFDVAADRIEKRLRRYKRRLVDHHHAHAAAGAIPEEEARQYVLAAEDESSGEAQATGDNPAIVAETSIRIHTLSVGEAVMRMELAELPVLLFRNSGNKELNLVYRRADGNIGWIETDNLGR